MNMTQEQMKAELEKLQGQLKVAAADAKLDLLAKIKELQGKLQDATK